MKLTVDFDLNDDLLTLPSHSAFARLLRYGKLTSMAMPLEAYTCTQFGLLEKPDFPIAAVAAKADGIAVGEAYWLRAEPVHLAMRRDSLSLNAPVPLRVNEDDALAILDALNAHFQDDGLQFLLGNSGAWYCRVQEVPQIKTTLPSEVLDRNIFNFMPQGQDASKWLAIINEAQMLLFAHTVNLAREAQGQNAVNSVWFSGGGVLPVLATPQQSVSLVIAQSPFYQGLAQLASVPSQTFSSLDEALMAQTNHVWIQANGLDDAWFSALLSALKTNKINKLMLNIGFCEKCLRVETRAVDAYQFWRRAKPVADYFND